ncbi:hypothetical protein B0H11DRAFT_1914997 [Mycena galericulata]|nr:hypothetical protein B0H11DRAFT_1914997 [Mycena galericulata]
MINPRRQALENSETLEELAWAYSLIQERVKNATDVAYKFYVQGTGIITSPATMHTSLYEEMDNLDLPLDRFRIFAKHLHISSVMGQARSELYQSNRLAPIAKLSPIDIESLKHDFLDRGEEDNPVAKVWNQDTNEFEELMKSWLPRGEPTSYVTNRSKERQSAMQFQAPEAILVFRTTTEVSAAAIVIVAVEARDRDSDPLPPQPEQ